MRKIMMLMLVVTIATPVLRGILGSDPDAQRTGWVGSLPGLGGTTPAATAQPAAVAPAAAQAQLPRAPVAASPVVAPPMVWKPGGGQRPPASPKPGTNQGLGADGTVSPELMRFLHPSFVPGQPNGGAAGGGPTGGGGAGAGTASAGTAGAGTADRRAAATPGAPGPDMLKTLAEQIRANPAAFKDQIGAVAKALTGK